MCVWGVCVCVGGEDGMGMSKNERVYLQEVLDICM